MQPAGMFDGIYCMETNGRSFGTFMVAKRVLFDERSAYQRVTVYETPDMGRVLMLDNVFNVSDVMEAFYHEPMAHIPLAMVDSPKRVLIIGGGDFGVASHVLKHQDVQELVMCELDPLVLDVARKFFPQWARAEQDHRMKVVVGDGDKYLNQVEKGSFDVIIVDSTDPYMFAPMLVSRDFYSKVANALKVNGVLMQIVADAIFFKDAWKEVIPNIKGVLKYITPIFLPVPFYATGPWGLMIARNGDMPIDPSRVSQDYLDSIVDLQTMTSNLVQGWFSLPPYIKRIFQDLL